MSEPSSSGGAKIMARIRKNHSEQARPEPPKVSDAADRRHRSSKDDNDDNISVGHIRKLLAGFDDSAEAQDAKKDIETLFEALATENDEGDKVVQRDIFLRRVKLLRKPEPPKVSAAADRQHLKSPKDDNDDNIGAEDIRKLLAEVPESAEAQDVKKAIETLFEALATENDKGDKVVQRNVFMQLLQDHMAARPQPKIRRVNHSARPDLEQPRKKYNGLPLRKNHSEADGPQPKIRSVNHSARPDLEQPREKYNGLPLRKNHSEADGPQPKILIRSVNHSTRPNLAGSRLERIDYSDPSIPKSDAAKTIQTHWRGRHRHQPSDSKQQAADEPAEDFVERVMVALQRILRGSPHAVTRKDARIAKQWIARSPAVEPRLERLAREQPEVFARGYVALYDHLIAIRHEEIKSLSLTRMRAKRDKVALLHPELAHRRGLEVGSSAVRRMLQKLVLSQLAWWGNTAGGLFAASLWYDWPNWVRWARTGGGQSNATWLHVADKIVVFLVLLRLMEVALRHIPGAVLGSAPDSYGQVMTVRRWLLYGHYTRSPAPEWLAVVLYVALNMLNVVFLDAGAAVPVPDPLVAVATVVRIALAVWSSFRLAVRGYAWSVRNHKLLSLPAEPQKATRLVAVLVAAGVAFLAWDCAHGFSVVGPVAATGLNATKAVIDTVLAPHYKSGRKQPAM